MPNGAFIDAINSVFKTVYDEAYFRKLELLAALKEIIRLNNE